MKKNLVMSAAKGYNFYELEPFLLSFKKNCRSADLILFVDELSDFTAKKIKDTVEGVQLIPIPDNLKKNLIIDVRWTMYKNFLKKNSDVKKIFLSDIADVIFQEDIFEKFSAQKNFLAIAMEGIKIEEDPIDVNGIWIRRLFGAEEYQKLKNNTVICCGTVLGTREEIEILCDKMIEILKRSSDWGDEQAAMNYLVHNKLLPIKNLIKSDVVSGEILTCSTLKNYKTETKKILRGDGKIPSVVHQYNRKPNLISFVEEVHREKFFDIDKNFSDFKSLFDEVFSLVSVRQWKEATQIFVGKCLYNSEIKNFNKKILKLYDLILSRLKFQNFDAEILISAVQKILCEIYEDKRLTKEDFDILLRTVDFCLKNCHTLNSQFQMWTADKIKNFVELFMADGNLIDALKYMEFMQKLNLNFTEDFYLKLSSIYRQLGEKDLALKNYKKVLGI